jgi:MraZ protein
MEKYSTALFFGRYEMSLDEKSRLSIPARLRRLVPKVDDDTLMLMPGLDGCIVAYPQVAYQAFWARIAAKKETSARQVKWLERVLGEKTAAISFDKQGRFVVPSGLLEHAGISDQALMLGVQDKIEIWNPQTYDSYCNEHGLDLNALSEELGI